MKNIEHVVTWINPDDELPPLGELVIVRLKPHGNIVAFDNITDHGGWLHHSYMNDRARSDVMYWMPLPKAPVQDCNNAK